MDYFNNYTRQCKDTQGGIIRAYLIPFVEYDETQIKTSGMSLTTFPDSIAYTFNCIGNYTQSSEEESGAVSWSQTITLQLPKVYEVIEINAFLRNDWRVIVETNNDQLIMFGLFNGLVCSSTNSSGTGKSEFNGFDLTFTGKEEDTGMLINSFDDLIMTFEDGEVFNYDLNLEIS